MKEKKIKIEIAEPWDFTSSDGDNVVFVKKVMDNQFGTIVEVLSKFEGSAKYLLLEKRGEENAYNIYSIDEAADLKEMESGDIKEFLLIGSALFKSGG